MNFKEYLLENTNPKREAALAMINELNNYPKAPSWEGYPTWDFGNNVHISLTNEHRDLDSDIIQRDNSDNLDIWYIENISSADRGNGYATLAMKKLIDMAKRCKIKLRLYPKRTSKGKSYLNDAQLRSWYLKLGFQKISNLYYELI